MRCGHGGAARGGIASVASVVTRTRVRARSSNIGFYPAAAIPDDRSTAAKTSNVIGAGNESADRIRSRVDRWWLRHRGASGTGVACCDNHLDASRSLSFNRCL